MFMRLEMAAFRCLLYFSGPHLFRWTENYFWLGPTAEAAMDALYALAVARQPLLGDQIWIDRLRVNDDMLERWVIPAGIAQTQRAAGSTLHPSVTVLVHLQSNDGGVFSRSAYLRGFSKAVCQLDPAGKSQVQGWLSTLASLGFSLKCQARTKRWPLLGVAGFANNNSDALNNPLPNYPPESYDAYMVLFPQDDTGIQVTNPQTGYPSFVNVRGVRFAPEQESQYLEVNGDHEVTDVTGGVITARGAVPPEGSIPGTGSVGLVGWVYPRISNGIIRGVRNRNTGGNTNYSGRITTPWRGGAGVVAEPIPAPVLVPPVPFPPGPSAPPQPVSVTFKTAYDVVTFLSNAYAEHPDGNTYPITIAQLQNRDDAWVVLTTGTSLKTNQATGISEDITSSFEVLDSYLVAMLAAVTKTIPPGSLIYLAGDSLGGMEAQNAIPYLRRGGYNVSNLTTFNSPVTQTSSLPLHSTRFAIFGDAVISTTAIGQKLRIGGHRDQTFLKQPQYPFQPYLAHTAIYTAADLQGWDALGFAIDGSSGEEMELGTQLYFQAPRVP